MKFLVTGGAGLIGSYLVKELIKEGYEVVVIDDFSSGFIEALPADVTLYTGSIGNQSLLDKIFSKHNIDLVFHLALSESQKHDLGKDNVHWKYNYNNTEILISSMIKYDIPKIIFSSSASVYGANKMDKSLLETSDTNPETPFAESMLAVEELITHSGLDYVIFRYFNAAGKIKIGATANTRKTLIPTLLDKIVNNNHDTEIFGSGFHTKDGYCVRDFIHIDDIVKAHFLAAERLVKRSVNRILNLGTGKGYSVVEVIDKVEELTGFYFIRKVTKRRPGDPIRSIASFMNAYNVLGWSPTKTLDDIIKEEYSELLRSR